MRIYIYLFFVFVKKSLKKEHYLMVLLSFLFLNVSSKKMNMDYIQCFLEDVNKKFLLKKEECLELSNNDSQTNSRKDMRTKIQRVSITDHRDETSISNDIDEQETYERGNNSNISTFASNNGETFRHKSLDKKQIVNKCNEFENDEAYNKCYNEFLINQYKKILVDNEFYIRFSSCVTIFLGITIEYFSDIYFKLKFIPKGPMEFQIIIGISGHFPRKSDKLRYSFDKMKRNIFNDKLVKNVFNDALNSDFKDKFFYPFYEDTVELVCEDEEGSYCKIEQMEKDYMVNMKINIGYGTGFVNDVKNVLRFKTSTQSGLYNIKLKSKNKAVMEEKKISSILSYFPDFLGLPSVFSSVVQGAAYASVEKAIREFVLPLLTSKQKIVAMSVMDDESLDEENLYISKFYKPNEVKDNFKTEMKVYNTFALEENLNQDKNDNLCLYKY